MMDRHRMLLSGNDGRSYLYYDNNDGILETQYSKALKGYQIYGNSVQDGTPSPDNPIEIQSVGDYDEESGKYKIPIEVKGKNLFECGKPTSSGASWEVYGNGFKITSATNAGGYSNYAKIRILSLADMKWGQTYTLSCYVEQSNPSMSSLLRIGYTDGSSNVFKSFINQNPENNKINYITFTLPNEQPDNFGSDSGSYGTDNIVFFINVQRAALDTYENICITDIMLVEGEEPAEYEPHIPTQNYDIFLDEPLRKVGTYADYIDFRSGKIVRVIDKKVFAGSESIDIPSSVIEGYTPFRNTVLDGTYPFLCSKLPYFEINYGSAIGKGECIAKYGLSGNNQIFFIISNDRIPLDDTDAFKIWLKQLYSNGNPITVYYCLKIPIEELIDLPRPVLNNGTNYITVKTKIQPSKVNWQYYK